MTSLLHERTAAAVAILNLLLLLHPSNDVTAVNLLRAADVTSHAARRHVTSRAEPLRVDGGQDGSDNNSLNSEARQHRQDVIRTFKSTMLHVLGLKKEPRPRGKVRIPPHMIELYREYTAKNRRRKSVGQGGQGGAARSRLAAFPGNTIRSFVAHTILDEPSPETRQLKRAARRAARQLLQRARQGGQEAANLPLGAEEPQGPLSALIHFNMSADMAADFLHGAELRLYRHREGGLTAEPTSAHNRTKRSLDMGSLWNASADFSDLDLSENFSRDDTDWEEGLGEKDWEEDFEEEDDLPYRRHRRDVGVENLEGGPGHQRLRVSVYEVVEEVFASLAVDSVSSRKGDSVDSEAEGSVDSQMGDAVDSRTGDSIDSTTVDFVQSQTGDLVDSKTGDSVDSQTRESLASQTRESSASTAKNSASSKARISVTPRANSRRSRLLDTRLIPASQTAGGWESFDASPAVAGWIRSNSRGLLEIRVATENGVPIPPERHFRLTPSTTGRSPDRIPRRNGKANSRKRRTVSEIDDDAHVRPLLVTYSDDERAQARRREHASTSPDPRRPRRAARAPKAKSPKNALCRRRALYVDFHEVDWNDWIIAPPGYDAYVCAGACPTILPDHLNATNHAQVQSLLHSVDPRAVPAPCCVPTELLPISMLYIDDSEKVVLRNYQDMVVESCGCR